MKPYRGTRLSRGRAYRRAQIERLKKARAHYWGGNASATPRLLGMVVSTPCPCSCPMCGHRRKWDGPTVQERRMNGDKDHTQHQGS